MRPTLAGIGCAALAWGVCANVCVQAATLELTLTPIADATIFAEQPGGTGFDNVADGRGGNLWSSVIVAGVVRRSLLRFDISGIPAGATVVEVHLTLQQIRARDNGEHRVHRLTEAWTEGPANGGDAGIGAPAQTGDVTWSHRTWPATPWAQRGGSIVAAPSSTVFVGAAPSPVTWPSTAALVADVQGWRQQPASNHGWLVIGQEGPEPSAKRWGSRDNTEPLARPTLRVVYEPAQAQADVPLPAWALGLLAGLLGAGLAWQRRRPGR